MKNINRLLAAAAILLSAAACHTNEIDPVKPDPVNPGKSGLTITANIVKTRVTYNDRNEDYLDQQWEVGDILFGYYYDGKVKKKVILKVDYLDSEDDYNAILIPVECDGVATLKDLADLNEGDNVDLVYTGKNIEDFGDNLEGIVADLFGTNLDGPLTVDLRSQDGIRIPACMHARAAIVVDEDDENKKSLFFKFVNDCAIIEIYSLTGIREDTNIDLENGADLTSLSVTNLVLAGEYTLGKDGFEFGASEIVARYDDVPVVTDYVKYFETNDWSVDSDGIISGGNAQERYLLAVVPNIYINDITVSATIDGSTETYSFDYGNHDFDAGKCYVIRDAEVVAKTVDGLYFTTVKAAFDHAHEIRLDHPDDNTVTLVKDEIYGLVNHAGIGPIDETIVIDYPVTLDLNGCWLYLGDVNEDGEYDNKNISESFIVSADEKFTISDPNEGVDMGGIWSDGNSAASIITNKGTVIIENGEIDQWGSDDVDEPIIIENYGSLTVDGGNFDSFGPVIDSYDGSNTTVSGDDTFIRCDSEESYAISIQGNQNATGFTMTGGEVNLLSGAVRLDGGKVNGEISGGKISCAGDGHALLVQNGSSCIIKGKDTEISNASGYSEVTSSVVFLDKATLSISDGTIYSKNGYTIYSIDSKCTISGGTIKGQPNTKSKPSIYCSTTAESRETDPSFVMSGGVVGGGEENNGGLKILLTSKVYGKITGGTITSRSNHAIQLSGAVLDIDGAKKDVTISSGNQDENKPDMASILVGEGSECNISGINTSVSNKNGYAVEIIDSECMLSGGKFVNNSVNYPAIYCYRSTSKTTTDLTIKWAKDSSEPDSPREGPLIVCTYVPDDPNDPTYIPSYLGAVSTKDFLSQESEEAEPKTNPNYAKVDISGGYLYSNDGAVFSKSSTSDVSIANCYTNLGSMVVGGGLTHSPYYEDGTQYIDSICLDPNQVQIGGYGFMFKITPGEKPDSDIPGSADPLDPIGKIEL